MRIQLKCNWAVLLSILMTLSLVQTAWADTASNEVLAAAESGLPVFLNAIPASELSQYGFPNREELAQARLGEPYQVYLLSPSSLQSFQAGSRLAGLLTKTNQWYFPVLVAGEPRTMLTVDFLQGQWQAVAIGGLDLPKNLARARKMLPESMAAITSENYTFQFVRVPQAYAEFLAIESAGGDYLMPVKIRPQSLKIENLQIYPLEKVAAQLAPIVEKNIQLDKDGTNATFGGGGGIPATGQPPILPWIGAAGVLLIAGVAIFIIKKSRAGSFKPHHD